MCFSASSCLAERSIVYGSIQPVWNQSSPRRSNRALVFSRAVAQEGEDFIAPRSVRCGLPTLPLADGTPTDAEAPAELLLAEPKLKSPMTNSVSETCRSASGQIGWRASPPSRAVEVGQWGRHDVSLVRRG